MAEYPNPQLRKLATRIPDKLIGKNHSKKDAADHTVTTQILLSVLGPYTQEVRQVLYSSPKKGGEPVLNGVILALTVEIDGRQVTVEEAGGMENATNADGDGERLKHCISDALKRCAMRLGSGLHIWAGKMYFLDRTLKEEAAEQIPEDVQVDTSHPESDLLREGYQEMDQAAPDEPASSPDADGGEETPPPVVEQEEQPSFGKGDNAKASGAMLTSIKELCEEMFDGGVEEVEKLKGKKISTLTKKQALLWIRGLEKKRSERIEKARNEMKDMKGAAVPEKS